MFRVFPFDADTSDAAERRAGATPVYDRSHRGTDTNLVGALGEMVFEAWLRREQLRFHFDSRTTHDCVIGRGLRVEVKKDRTVIPRPHYEATIPAYNADHQDPDWYVFLSLHRQGNAPGPERFRVAYLVGCYPAGCFVADARLWHAGEVDPANGTKFWTDCYNLHIGQLLDIDRLAEAARAGAR